MLFFSTTFLRRQVVPSPPFLLCVFLSDDLEGRSPPRPPRLLALVLSLPGTGRHLCAHYCFTPLKRSPSNAMPRFSVDCSPRSSQLSRHTSLLGFPLFPLPKNGPPMPPLITQQRPAFSLCVPFLRFIRWRALVFPHPLPIIPNPQYCTTHTELSPSFRPFIFIPFPNFKDRPPLISEKGRLRLGRRPTFSVAACFPSLVLLFFPL